MTYPLMLSMTDSQKTQQSLAHDLAAIIQPVDRPGVVFQILAVGGRVGSPQ